MCVSANNPIVIYICHASTYTYDNLGRLTLVSTYWWSKLQLYNDARGNILAVICKEELAVTATDPQDQAVDVHVYQTILIQFNQTIEVDINYEDIA